MHIEYFIMKMYELFTRCIDFVDVSHYVIKHYSVVYDDSFLFFHYYISTENNKSICVCMRERERERVCKKDNQGTLVQVRKQKLDQGQPARAG